MREENQRAYYSLCDSRNPHPSRFPIAYISGLKKKKNPERSSTLTVLGWM
jgi:hypothetical protein